MTETKLSKLFGAIGELVNEFIALLFIVATVLFLFGVVKYLSAARGDGDLAQAKKFMTWGIISLFIILAFWAIVFIVADSLFG